MSFSERHLQEAREIIDAIDVAPIERMVTDTRPGPRRWRPAILSRCRRQRRQCSHAVNDFRKIVGIEAYAPTDNVSELTARTNDEGWETVFVEWLKTSRLRADDALFMFSVGGGNLEKNVSPNLVRAMQYAKRSARRCSGIVGRDGGYTAKVGDAVVIVPTVNPRCRDAALGSVSGGDLAPAGHASAAQEPSRPNGKRHVNGAGCQACRVSRPRRSVERSRSSATASRTRRPIWARCVITSGARAALEELKREGLMLIVVTNQPDVARGKANARRRRQYQCAPRCHVAA